MGERELGQLGGDHGEPGTGRGGSHRRDVGGQVDVSEPGQERGGETEFVESVELALAGVGPGGGDAGEHVSRLAEPDRPPAAVVGQAEDGVSAGCFEGAKGSGKVAAGHLGGVHPDLQGGTVDGSPGAGQPVGKIALVLWDHLEVVGHHAVRVAVEGDHHPFSTRRPGGVKGVGQRGSGQGGRSDRAERRDETGLGLSSFWAFGEYEQMHGLKHAR